MIPHNWVHQHLMFITLRYGIKFEIYGMEYLRLIYGLTKRGTQEICQQMYLQHHKQNKSCTLKILKAWMCE